MLIHHFRPGLCFHFGVWVLAHSNVLCCTQVKLWHYLPNKWNGSVAEEMYRGPIFRALKRYRGDKPNYMVLEDNDPTGYKSNAAKGAKAEMGICPMDYPKHSPDLNPMDYFLWTEVQRRMASQPTPNKESLTAFKARLRRTAFAIPEHAIRKAVMGMRDRAKSVIDADGGDIPRD